MKRNRSRPHSFEDQLAKAAFNLKAQARKLRPGEERDALLQKVRQIDAAAHLNKWLKPADLRFAKATGQRKGGSDDR
jgi:hypothetical protein